MSRVVCESIAALGRLDQAASARGWLYRIAQNTAYDHLRRQRRIAMTPLTDAHEAIASAAALESQFADVEPVWVALNHLPDHYRVPLVPKAGSILLMQCEILSHQCSASTFIGVQPTATLT
jgi:DNA-directed RNA polymerase specialized sigma24 family protein